MDISNNSSTNSSGFEIGSNVRLNSDSYIKNSKFTNNVSLISNGVIVFSHYSG